MNSLAKLQTMSVVPPRQVVNLTRQPTIAASAAIKVKRALAGAGLDPAPLFAAQDFPLTGDPEARVPYERYCRLMRAASEALGRPSLGLDLAQGARLADLDVLGEVIRYARDGFDALLRLQRYHVILSEASRFRFEEEGETLAIYYETPGISPEWQALDDQFTLAMTVVAARELLDAPWRPESVAFSQARPADLAPFLAAFGVAPQFDAAVSRIRFDRAVLAQRFPTPVSRMERIALDTAEGLIDARDSSTPAERAREAVVACLPAGAVSIGAVADRMMVSVRTLQRELERTGTTFRALVDEVRAAEARRLLAESGRTYGEIAFLLGFSEPSAFVRAFRRWHGVPPSRFFPAGPVLRPDEIGSRGTGGGRGVEVPDPSP